MHGENFSLAKIYRLARQSTHEIALSELFDSGFSLETGRSVMFSHHFVSSVGSVFPISLNALIRSLPLLA